MPLRVRPVRLRDSLYLLIPVDIARLIGAVPKSSFNLTLVEEQNVVRLVYEMKKPEEGEDEAGGELPG